MDAVVQRVPPGLAAMGKVAFSQGWAIALDAVGAHIDKRVHKRDS